MIRCTALALAIVVILSVMPCGAMTYYADAENGNDNWDGLSPFHVEGNVGPVRTLAAAVDRAHMTADIIMVADGVYAIQETGSIAHKLEYFGLILKSANGPENCVIDCRNVSGGFYFSANYPGEHPPTIEGFSIINVPDRAVECHGYTNVVIKDCVFSVFSFRPPEQIYSVITCRGNALPHIVDCEFNGFMVQWGRGVILCHSKSAPVIENCRFNRTAGGSAILCTDESSPVISGCEITDTTGDDYVAGIFCEIETTPRIRDCVIKKTTSPQRGAGIFCHFENRVSTVVIDGCTISDGSIQTGGGIVVEMNGNADVTITNCTISGNSVSVGGGILGHGGNRFKIRDCTISDNRVSETGGGLYFRYGPGDISIANCVISNNQSFGGRGSGVCIDETFAGHIRNCTIVDNSALNGDGQVDSHSVDVSIENSIIWKDESIPITGRVSEMAVRYCNLNYLGQQPLPQWVGNISEDPLFALPGEDYHLKSEAGRYDPRSGTWVRDDVSSPCIDAGDPGVFCADEPRGSGGRINMGAYGGTIHASKTERCSDRIAGDTNNDCRIDMKDLALIAANWARSTVEEEEPQEPGQ